MPAKLSLYAAVLVALLPFTARHSNASPADSEMKQRQFVLGQVANAFYGERYQDIENIVEDLLVNRRKTSSGSWLNPQIYGVFGAGTEEQFLKSESQILKWIDSKPRSRIAHVAYANLLMSYAWILRGNGFYPQVPEAGREGFARLIEKCRDVLERSKEFSSSNPQWFTLMLLLATYQGWEHEDFYNLLKEAALLEPTYTESYFSASLRTRPQWGGSRDEAEDLFDLVVGLTRDTEGTSFYARMYLERRNETDAATGLIPLLPVTWPRLSAAFRDLIERYPTAWNRNGYASYACLAGDKAVLREQLERIGDEIERAIWSRAASTDACRRWAFQ